MRARPAVSAQNTFARPLRSGRLHAVLEFAAVSWQAWLLFATTETGLCLTPGPAVLFVLSHGLAAGGRASLWANAGILAGNAFYFLLSALGLGVMLIASQALFTAIKYAGAAYLIYLGARTIGGAGLALRAEAAADRTANWRTLTRGFALQAANPKALVFFVAFLPQFIDTNRALAPQVAILAVTSVVIEFLVLAGYGYLAARTAALARRPALVAAVTRVSGFLLMAAGVGVALSSDS